MTENFLHKLVGIPPPVSIDPSVVHNTLGSIFSTNICQPPIDTVVQDMILFSMKSTVFMKYVYIFLSSKVPLKILRPG